MAELGTDPGPFPRGPGPGRRHRHLLRPQLDAIADWTRSWGEAGAEFPPHGIGHDEPVPGMLDERAVTRLEKLDGRAFDREFRRLMARHHRGGLELVNRQLAAGFNPEARALADRLRTMQTAQLRELTRTPE